MFVTDLEKKLQQISLELVVVRARQFPIEHGRVSRTRLVPEGELTQHGKSYKVANEIQAIACHPSTYTYDGRKPGFIWLRYVDPAPNPRYPDYEHPPKLRSAAWIGQDCVEEAWRLICASWIDCPSWLSQKPVVFCRQFEPDGEYVLSETSDIMFMRRLDHLAQQVHQHKLYYENRMNKIAEKTPVGNRGEVYRAHLQLSDIRSNLLDSIQYRLNSLVDDQFEALTTSLGVVEVQSREIFAT